MKKIILGIICLLLIVFMFVSPLFNKKDKNDNELVTIKVAEVTHSIFYAPWYIAIENGYFEDEGINIELILTPGADKVAAAVLSKDVDVGFCGPEATIYVYNGNEEDYLVTFAGLTKRDGQFIVSRNKINNFNYEMLKGKEVLAGRKGGMPELNFENGLRNKNIDIEDVKINTSIDFASLSGAFIGGTGDFVNLFEPNALKLEKEGYGYVVGSVGEISGEMTYTAFNARKSFLESNKELLTKFSHALARGIKYVINNNSKSIALSLQKQFPDLSIDDIEKIVDRYKNADSWLKNPYIEEKLFNNLQEIMINSKLAHKLVSFNDLVHNLYYE